MPDIAVPDDIHDAQRDRVLDEEVGDVVAVGLVVAAGARVDEAALAGGEVTGAALGVFPPVPRPVAGHVATEASLLRFLHGPQGAWGNTPAGGGIVDGTRFRWPAAVGVARGRCRGAR